MSNAKKLKILTPVTDGATTYNAGDEAAFLETKSGQSKRNLQRLAAMGVIELPARGVAAGKTVRKRAPRKPAAKKTAPKRSPGSTK
jgi:hypothetical protein